MQISREIQLDYGHTLPNHYSFCNQIHGHRARVIATIEGEVSKIKNDSSQGMVMDFKFLKTFMMEYIHKILDHGFAVWKEDKEDFDFIIKRNKKFLVLNDPPTAENLAKWAFNQLKDKFSKNIILIKVDWYETPSSFAIYTKEDLKNEKFSNK